jgi:hypothetical protein
MSPGDILIPLAALLLGIAVTVVVMRRRRAAEPPPVRAKILFPFVGAEPSERALQATLRLAWAEQAVIVPAYLATVPLPLALDAPVGRACDDAFTAFEAIETRAAKVGVPVDGRIARGRNVRHALRELMAEVPAARMVIAGDGFGVDDIAWILRNAPGEVLVVRPAPAPRERMPRPCASSRASRTVSSSSSPPSWRASGARAA